MGSEARPLLRFFVFHFCVWALCTLKSQPAIKRKTSAGVFSLTESCDLLNASSHNALQADAAGRAEPVITRCVRHGNEHEMWGLTR